MVATSRFDAKHNVAHDEIPACDPSSSISSAGHSREGSRARPPAEWDGTAVVADPAGRIAPPAEDSLDAEEVVVWAASRQEELDAVGEMAKKRGE